MSDHPALSIPAAARLLSVSDLYVKQMIDSRRIKATRLDPSSPRSEWRIPRRELDPWCGPAEVAPDPFGQISERDAQIAEARARAALAGGGLGRRLAAIAMGEDIEPDTRPVVTSRYLDDSVRTTGVPDSTAAPVHEVEDRDPVVLTSTLKVRAQHPSEQYKPDRSPSGRDVPTVTSTVVDTGRRDQPSYEGQEAPPFDGDSFGAGKAPGLPPAAR